MPVEDLKSAEMTGQWEKRLHDVAAGKEDYNAFISDMNKTIRNWYSVIEGYTGETFISKEKKEQLSCPFCGAKVIKKNGTGTFDAYLVVNKAEKKIKFEFPKK